MIRALDSIPPQQVVKAGVIGTGHYATAIVCQAQSMSRLDVSVVADVDVAKGLQAYRHAGVEDDRIVVCDSRATALDALERGAKVVLEDAGIMMELPITLVAEATGSAEAGACHVAAAIRHGKHVAMVNKEADVSVGPILKHRADRAGVVYTAVDGDQHGLLIGLVDWARALGLHVIAGGKACDGEYLHDPVQRTVTRRTRQRDDRVALDDATAPAFDPIPPRPTGPMVATRRHIAWELPGPGGWDLGEMAIAANATGLLPDVPELHAPIVRVAEIPEVLCTRDHGGILARDGAIDAVICLRQPLEAGLGGGVFVVVDSASEYSRHIMVSKGLIANRRGTAALIYRPYHLCGVETPLSMLWAGLLGAPTGTAELLPRVDVVARAGEALKAGDTLPGDHSPKLQSLMLPAEPVAAAAPLPLHLGSGNRLACDVPAGTVLTAAMVERPEDSTLWALRTEQDAHFLGASAHRLEGRDAAGI